MAAVVQNVTKTEEAGSFLSRIPWYYQMALLVGLVALLIYATDALLFSDTRAQTEKMLEEVQGLKVKNAQGSIVRQNLAEVEAALAEKREEMDRLRDLLPDQVEISRVYDNIKDLMRNNRLELKQFGQGNPEPAEIFTAQKILVQVSGGYDNIGQFFSQLAFYKRILSVTDVDIKQAEDVNQDKGRSVNCAFVLTAYYISPANLENLSKKAPAPAPAANAPKPNQPK